jgi:hypothetical protein
LKGLTAQGIELKPVLAKIANLLGGWMKWNPQYGGSVGI